jgi:hypothetical protein
MIYNIALADAIDATQKSPKVSGHCDRQRSHNLNG